MNSRHEFEAETQWQEEKALEYLAITQLPHLLIAMDGLTDEQLEKVITACEVVIRERRTQHDQIEKL